MSTRPRGPLSLDLDECARDPEASRGLIEAFLEEAASGGADAGAVEIRTSQPARLLSELIERCHKISGRRVQLRLLGPRCLAAPWLRGLGRCRDALEVVLLVLDTIPSGAAVGWTLDRLEESLQALSDEDLEALVDFRVRARDAASMPALRAVAESVTARGRGPVLVRIESIRPGDSRDDARQPPSFKSLGPLLRLAAERPDLVDVQSECGSPLCLFPRRLRGALLLDGGGGGGDRRDEAPGDAVFGETCDSCLVREFCGGASRGYAERYGTADLEPVILGETAASKEPAELSWANRARLLLIGHPDEIVQLKNLLPAEQMPPWPCALPWTRLERTSNGFYGPCCPDYLSNAQWAGPEVSPPELWNSDHMRTVRSQMTAGGHPAGCRRSCPVLASGSHRPSELSLRGGSPTVVENQIAVVEAMVRGDAHMEAPPLELCIAVTSHCNYDCIMCCVDKGPLDDQLGEPFYAGLEPWLDRLMPFDANGGEPLASPVFRSFLENNDFSACPQLRVHLTTNGSYLTPKQLERYGDVPFSALTISFNAATAETYEEVNRGIPFERIRRNVDALREGAGNRGIGCALRYSFVILRRNLEEIVPFAEMARSDGVGVRYLLPTNNRNEQSIMLEPALMREAARALDRVRDLLGKQGGDPLDVRDIDGVVTVLEARIEEGLLEIL
jgi:hypothetical protein